MTRPPKTKMMVSLPAKLSEQVVSGALPVLPSTKNAQLDSRPTDSGGGIHEKILDGLYDGVYFVDRDRRITFWNRSAEALSGYTSEEAVGTYCYNNLLEHVSDCGIALCTNGCPLQATLLDGQRRQADVFLRHKGGHRVPIQVRVTPITGENGEVIGAAEIFSGGSGRVQPKAAVEDLDVFAFRDQLTGLANRRYSELKVKQAVQERLGFARNFGLLMIDIDHFSNVNDSYGNDIGDVLLQTVSRTLSLSLRRDDMAGRWGGDEFIVLLVDLPPEVLIDISERCRKLIGASVVNAAGGPVRVTASIGATVVRDDDSAISVLQRATELLQHSKAQGRNRTVAG